MNKRIRKKKEKQAEAARTELILALTREGALETAVKKITEAIVAITGWIRCWGKQMEAKNGKAADGEGGR